MSGLEDGNRAGDRVPINVAPHAPDRAAAHSGHRPNPTLYVWDPGRATTSGLATPEWMKQPSRNPVRQDPLWPAADAFPASPLRPDATAHGSLLVPDEDGGPTGRRPARANRIRRQVPRGHRRHAGRSPIGGHGIHLRAMTATLALFAGGIIVVTIALATGPGGSHTSHSAAHPPLSAGRASAKTPATRPTSAAPAPHPTTRPASTAPSNTAPVASAMPKASPPALMASATPAASLAVAAATPASATAAMIGGPQQFLYFVDNFLFLLLHLGGGF
jgi:hypothetical protein